MAEVKISDLPALGASPSSDDLVVVVDVSDTTSSPEGTTKYVTMAELLSVLVDQSSPEALLVVTNTVEPIMRAFRVPSMTDLGDVALPGGAAGSDEGCIAWTPDGSKLFVGDNVNGHMYVYDAALNLLDDFAVNASAGRLNFCRMTMDGTICWVLDRAQKKLYPIDTSTHAVGTAVTGGGWGGGTFIAYDFVLSDDGATAWVCVFDTTAPHAGGKVYPVTLATGAVGTGIVCTHGDPGKIVRIPGTTLIIVNNYFENVYDLIDTANPGVILKSWTVPQGSGSGDPGAPIVSPDGTKAFLGVSDGSVSSAGIIVSLTAPYPTLVTCDGYPDDLHWNIWNRWSADGAYIYSSNLSYLSDTHSQFGRINVATGAVATVPYGDEDSGGYGGALTPSQTGTVIYDGTMNITT